jgi:RHS repeat-associated protein
MVAINQVDWRKRGMTHKKIAQETEKLDKKQITERIKKFGFISSILLTLFLNSLSVSAQSGGTAEPQKSETGNKADQNLKSIARVNPSTLAMEMSLPLMTYPGRNGNSLPVGFSYSSKIWQMDSSVTWFYFQEYTGVKKYLTDVSAEYAERTSAGWTSMMMPPRIDESLDIYNQYGKPFAEHYDGMTVLSLYQENIQSIISNGLIQRCGVKCNKWGYVLTENPGHIYSICEQWVIAYCTVYSSTPGSETPYQNPDRTHYVKRVRVAMPDGSTHEFRKSDKVFSFCGSANYPFNGTNCEQLGEDVYGTFLAVDTSGMKLVRNENGSTLYLPNGSKYLFPANPENIRGLYATDYFDADGNRLAFSQTVDRDSGIATNKWVDTLGREIIDPMPHNWDSQKLPIGTFDAKLPGLADDTQDYKMKWLPLKPHGCEESMDEYCGKEGEEVLGALEDQSQKLYYSNPKFCQGNLTTDLPYGEVLFPAYKLGYRSCNPFKIEDIDGTPTVVAARFNPVVLAEVKLPNGKSYNFKYNRYGEISKIIYPTGSYETFEYAQIAPLANYQSQLFDQINRGVIERKVYNADDVLEQRWNYSGEIQDVTNSTSPYIVTTIFPHRSDASIQNETGRMKSVRYLTRVPQPLSGGQYGNFGFDDPRGGLPFDERIYDENGNLRSRTLTEYIVSAAETGADARAVRDARPKRTISIIIEGDKALATLSELEYDVNGNSDREYFSSLNVKQSKSFHYKSISISDAQNANLAAIANYFAGETPSAISETDYQYNADYKTRGISSLPVESRVLNPANPNEILAKTQTVYDESGYLVADSGTLIGDLGNTWLNPNTSYRAKPTTSKVWQKETSSWIQTHTQYDQYGNIRKVWDASGDTNKFIETQYSLAYACAYPTKVITPAPDPTDTNGTSDISTAETTYDFTTGLILKVKDDFGQEMQTEYNDALLRPTKVSGVGNFVVPVTETIYDDTNLTVKVRKQIDATNWGEITAFSDSFGRTIKTQTKDSQGDVFVKTKYDYLGRVKEVSNPYRQNDTIYWSKTEYDELGRAVESFAPAQSSSTGDSLGTTAFSISTVTNYVGTVVTTTDASGRKSRSITNALGQLLRIDEATSVGGTADADLGSTQNPNQPTYYIYSPQGKMVKVQQGKAGEATIQYRYFLYDSLGRLIRVRQPEQEINASLNRTDTITGNNQWTAAFTYDVLGNLLTTTDANGTVVTNTYDKANRVINRSYSNEPNGITTPPVEYFYDGKGLPQEQSPNYAKGKLTKATNSISETKYTLFDKLGRLTQSQQITDGQTYTSSYVYNLSGALVEQTYPSGRKVKNEFETDGDLSRISGKANANATERTYANGFSYTPDGRIQRLRLGNGRWESAKFNNRLQVTELALGTSDGDGSLWKLNYEYGELNTNGTTVNQSKNTGNIARQTLSFNGLAQPFVQTFKYDSLYRLAEARETNNNQQTWKQTFGYDRFGNRINFTQQGGIPNLQPQIDAATNRFQTGQGYTYDFNGNLVQDAEGRTFTFNGENKQTKVVQSGQTIGEYFYDGEGKRVKKISNLETTVFVYDGLGKLVAEYSTATPTQNPTTSYTATDQLDSPRVITDSNGNVISRRDFMPFGEELTPDGQNRTTNRKYNTTDNIRQKFTGYQKDTETQLDFAEARMYENRHGRFTAVDPLLASGKSANPQTFNRYVYVMNNPLVLTDPSGLQANTNPNQQTDDDSIPIVIRTVICADGTLFCLPPIPTARFRTTYNYNGNSVTNSTYVPLDALGASSATTYGFGLSKGVATTTETTTVRIVPRFFEKVGEGILTGGKYAAGAVAVPLTILLMPTTVNPYQECGTTCHMEKEAETQPQTTSTPFSVPTPTATPNQFETVYRVYGGGSEARGWWWTPIDPRTVPNYRSAAALPDENLGTGLVIGTVRTSDIIIAQPAQPLGRHPGGGVIEYKINPANIIKPRTTVLTPPL